LVVLFGEIVAEPVEAALPTRPPPGDPSLDRPQRRRLGSVLEAGAPIAVMEAMSTMAASAVPAVSALFSRIWLPPGCDEPNL
jgi:hypothetical protein